MLKLKLYRFKNGLNRNAGLLVLDDNILCHTLELPWLENLKNVSCIPKGYYLVEKHISPRHRDCFKLNHVPSRSGILIHAGNTEADTQGCILVGQTSDLTTGSLGHSRLALNRLRDILPYSFNLDIL